MEQLTAIQRSRHRGQILQWLSQAHYDQASPLDDLAIWGLMMDLGYRVGQKYSLTLIQELRGAGYVTYTEEFRKLGGETRLERIMITHAGRRLIEGYERDEMVLIP